MIKLNELRIGNFFEIESHSTRKIKKVKEITEKQVLLNDAWYGLNKLIAIALSPEILVECGFAKFNWITESDIFDCRFFKCKLNGSGLQIFDDDFKNIKPLKYLHEFQNLYFDLTEQELNISVDKLKEIAAVSNI